MYRKSTFWSEYGYYASITSINPNFTWLFKELIHEYVEQIENSNGITPRFIERHSTLCILGVIFWEG